MSILDLKDVRAGTLQDARRGSILFPVGDSSGHFLVTEGAQDELFGVFLTGEYRFHTVMVVADGDNWAGFFVDDIRVEVDIESASDATNLRSPVGSIVKRSNGAFIVALAGQPHSFQHRIEMRLLWTEGAAAERLGVAFSRWYVVIGEGQDKVVLLTVDASLST